MSRSSISISNRATLVAVSKRALWFLAPILLTAGFAEFVFWRSRDCWPSPWVFDAMTRDPQTLYGPRYFDYNIAWLKLSAIRRDRPKIISLGSSRVTQFRAPMFAPHDAEFMNAGLLATNVNELEAVAARFLDGSLPQPRVMIVGIDPWWMKGDAGPAAHDSGPGDTASAAAHLAAMRAFLAKPEFPATLFRFGNVARNEAYGRNAIGLGAIAGNSYRSDGSVLQTGFINEYLRTRQYRDRETPPVITRIRQHTAQFGVVDGINWEQAGRIIRVMTELRNAGIEVYAFLPPFSTEADKLLGEDPTLSKWYTEYRERFREQIEGANFVCVNVRSPATFGLTDDYMLDGFHPGDVLMTHVLGALIAKAPAGSFLASVSADNLRQLREAPGVIPISLDPPAPR